MSENILKFALKGIIILSVISLGSCKNPSKQSAPINLDSIPITLAPADTLVYMFYSMPDPDEILNEIFVEDIEFKSGVVYSIEKADQLFEYNTIALHMGILMADMTYLILQEKNNLSIEYFKTVVHMSDKLDLRVFRDNDLLKKIEVNIDNRDALLDVFKETFSDIKYELDYSKRSKVLALIYTGSIIETFYLAINNIENNNTQLISEHILEQYSTLNSLAEFLSFYSVHPDINLIIEKLDSIKDSMNKCIARDSNVTVHKTEDNQLHINGGNIATYNLEPFDSVRNKISELRNIITEN